MVHSPLTAGLINDLYDSSPVVLPFAQYRTLPGDVGSLDRRRASRKVLGLNADEIVIVTFGHLSHDKGPEDLVWALKLLTEWGMEARLVFCGDANPDVHAHVRERAVDLGIDDRVTTFGDRVPEHIYIAYLDAADVGIQLRGYFMGGLSGALNDCIAAGLPSIANAHLASAMVAPDYVRRVPDNFSSVLIAEAAVEILDSGQNLRRPIEARTAFSARHSPTAYCGALLNALSLEEVSKALTVTAAIYVDITEFIGNPIRTGIQRLVREILSSWPDPDQLVPISFNPATQTVGTVSRDAVLYAVAHAYRTDESLEDALTQIAYLNNPADSTLVNLTRGDKVLIPELFFEGRHVQFYREAIQAGVDVGMVVPDFLVWLRTDTFPIRTTCHLMPLSDVAHAGTKARLHKRSRQENLRRADFTPSGFITGYRPRPGRRWHGRRAPDL